MNGGVPAKNGLRFKPNMKSRLKTDFRPPLTWELNKVPYNLASGFSAPKSSSIILFCLNVCLLIPFKGLICTGHRFLCVVVVAPCMFSARPFVG